MSTTADFKNGLCIEYNNDLYTIISFQHVKPGKGGAFVRSKLKSLTTSKVIENTFIAGTKIQTARIETNSYQFLYKEGTMYHFMNNNDYEQIAIEKTYINAPQFLKEGQQLSILSHSEKDKIISCELPPFVELEVTYTEPGFKGNTATKTLKPATLETGVEIQVPLFINNGDKVKIDTRTGNYSERVSG